MAYNQVFLYLKRSVIFLDLARPKSNEGSAGFTIEERQDFTDLLAEGFVDSFRHLYPEKEDAYSYWSYRANSRSKNVGWYVKLSGKCNLVSLNDSHCHANVCAAYRILYVTVFWKTNLLVTNTEIHFCLCMEVTLMHYPERPSILL